MAIHRVAMLGCIPHLETERVKMKTSESIQSLCAALVSAQADAVNAAFDSVNPHFRNKYASLAEVISTMKPVLAKHGLAVIQLPAFRQDVGPVLVTRIVHKSGEWMEDEYPINPVKNDPQGFGSAITYARRYTLPGILMIASEEDDDGNAASQRQPQPQPQRPASPQVPDAVKARIAELRPAVDAATSKDALKVLWDHVGIDKSDPVLYAAALELFNSRIAALKKG